MTKTTTTEDVLTDPVIDFSDVPDERPLLLPREDAPRRRGRPRSPETIARDERVLAALREGPRTKEQLVEQLGFTPQLVYLSLWRLNRTGLVTRGSGGAERHVWSVVA